MKYAVIDIEMCKVPKSLRTDEYKWSMETIQIGAVLLDEDYNIIKKFSTFEIKKHTTEKEEKPQMPVIRDFIEAEIARQKVIADELADDHNKDWTELNRIFMEVIE